VHLHSMTLQAIGPFAGRYSIDFEELGTSGIFLLEGPTGAGKSTVIDAIVFALYGKVASAEASEERLRSGHAADGVESFVDLVVETAAGVYRVRRTPQFDRPKRRGDGTVRQQATVKLWRLAGAPGGPIADHADIPGEIVSTRLDEAGAELQRAIGLDRAQFVQTIVLPQGEFANFLRAEPETRRGLLQKIFGTQAYELLQKQLEEMRREASRDVAEAAAAVRAAGAHFVGAASLTDDDDVDDQSDGPDADVRTGPAARIRAAADLATGDLLDLVEAQVAHLREAADRAALADDAARLALAAARERLEAMTAQAAALARRNALREERSALAGRADEHTAQLEQLAAARRAALVSPLLGGAERAETTLRTAVGRLVSARAGAPADLARVASASSTTPGGGARDLEAERDRCRTVAATLERVVGLEDTMPTARAGLEALVRQQAVADGDLDRVETELTGLPAARVEIAGRLKACAGLAAELGTRRALETAARERLQASRDAERTGSELVGACADRLQAVAGASAALAVETRLRAARIAGMAGELAESLVAGEACPVCGALEHPHPANVGADHASAEQVEAAAQARSVAENALAACAATIAALEERLVAQRAAAGGLDAAAAARQVEAAERLRVEAEAGLGAQRRAQDDLEAHDAKADECRTRAEDLRASRTAVAASVETLRATLDAQEREIDAARGGAATVRARRQALLAQADAATALVQAIGDVREATTASDVRARELAEGLAEQGFVDAFDARSCLRDPAAVTALDRSVTAHEQAVQRVAAGLAAGDLAGLPDGVRVDLESGQVQARAAERAAAERARALTLATQRTTSAARAMGETRQAVEHHAQVKADAAPVARMANLAAGATGDNGLALSLPTYVLVRRFEDVVAAANDRLLLMSDGRFELERSDEREDTRGRRTGLAMKVMDHQIETARDPRTLSGGETFYVSLCLALGMADVVTGEAGGIDLGTLFVDEGFGSLDANTLDAVLAELGKLRAGGRVVGVVSHVEAMKQQIAERIEVRRLPDGSSGLTVRSG
jgi:exonuclease SbcC